MVRNLVNSILADGGEDRLVRQKRATTLSTWTDGDGMWNVQARFDPEAAIRLAKRLDDTVEALFAESGAVAPGRPESSPAWQPTPTSTASSCATGSSCTPPAS